MKELLSDLLAIEVLLDDENEHVMEIWQRVRGAALWSVLGSPPAPEWAAVNGCRSLAEYFEKMGKTGGKVLRDSEGMERLVFRLVGGVEALHETALDVLRIYQGGATARRITKNGDGTVLEMALEERRLLAEGRKLDLQGWLKDFEEHQVSYCEGCGAEMTPSGKCPVCDLGLPISVRDAE